MAMVPGDSENNIFFKVEDYVMLAGDTVEPILTEIVDPFIAELDTNRNNAFTAVCINLISAHDSMRDYDSSLLIANRSFRVGQFIAFLAGAPEAELPIGDLLLSNPDFSKDTVLEYIHHVSHQELSESPTFKKLLYECRPSIDPLGREQDILDLFAGFALLSMNLGYLAAADKQSMQELGNNMAKATNNTWDNELAKWLEE
jgi:hypothetical protein